VTNAAAQRPVVIKAGDRWSPELVEVIKRAAVEARLGAGRLSVRWIGENRFSAGHVFGVRRIVVGIEHDDAGAPRLEYWREANPQVLSWHREMLRSRGLDLDRYEFPTEERLADGSVGYYVRAPRTDDCFAAALATALQVPIAEVPDPRIDERTAAGETPDELDRSAHAEITGWLTGRGLRMVVHRKLPTDRSRWIGIVQSPGAFNSHCVVMSRDEILFDPTAFHWPGMPPVQQCRFEHIGQGLSFQTIRATNKRKA
jgi:hypothetical protein